MSIVSVTRPFPLSPILPSPPQVWGRAQSEGCPLRYGCDLWLLASQFAAHPPPASLPDFLLNYHLTYAFPQLFVTDSFKPPDTDDTSYTTVDKGLVCGGECGPPIADDAGILLSVFVHSETGTSRKLPFRRLPPLTSLEMETNTPWCWRKPNSTALGLTPSAQ